MSSDELDIENRAALQSYLQSQFSPRDEFAIVEFEVLAGGVSSRTVRVKLSGGQEWVLKQALAKLRVAADWFSDPRRVHREALGMRVLGELTPPGSVPKLIFDDETHHVLGMEAVPQPHENWKTMLLAGHVEPKYAAAFGALLGRIHRGSRERADNLAAVFADRNYFESLRLEPYYAFGAAKEPRAAAFYEQLLADTRATNLSLVHGDYSPKNVLIHQGRLVLLDHEVCHWGDPAFDVGFALTHLLAKSLHVRNARRTLFGCAHLFVAEYLDEIGSSPLSLCLSDSTLTVRCVKHTLGCLLARVVGRSPLEYLSTEERDRQRETCVRLIHELPSDLPDLIERFVQEIEE